MSYAARKTRQVTGGVAEGIQSAGSALGSAASSAIASVRGVTGAAYDAIGQWTDSNVEARLAELDA